MHQRNKMKRILRLSALATVVVAAVGLAPVSQNHANADPLYRASNGGYYYGGGYYAPGNGGYFGNAYNPYGYGGYTYTAPSAYVYPSYNPYGVGTGAPYNVIINHGNNGSRFQPYSAAYNSYGYGIYGPYGY